jgi:alpha-mannosidase
VLEYALRFDAETLDDVALLRASQDYRTPFLAGAGEFVAPLSLEGDVVFSCLKGAEDGDGLVLRVFNPATASATARLTGDVSGLEALGLDETGGSPLDDDSFEVRAGEIATVRLRPRR